MVPRMKTKETGTVGSSIQLPEPMEPRGETYTAEDNKEIQQSLKQV